MGGDDLRRWGGRISGERVLVCPQLVCRRVRRFARSSVVDASADRADADQSEYAPRGLFSTAVWTASARAETTRTCSEFGLLDRSTAFAFFFVLILCRFGRFHIWAVRAGWVGRTAAFIRGCRQTHRCVRVCRGGGAGLRSGPLGVLGEGAPSQNPGEQEWFHRARSAV